MNATFLRRINPGLRAEQNVYRLEPAWKTHEHVVVSAMPAFGDRPPETVVFALVGEEGLGAELYTLPGAADHERALREMENQEQ